MSHPHKGHQGLDRILRAAVHSARGLSCAYRAESAFRQETWLAVVLIPAAFWLGRNPLEIAGLIGSVLLVLVVELLNSAVEATVDRISYEHHELSGRAKDFGSAAVALALALCAVVWAAVAIDRFLK